MKHLLLLLFPLLISCNQECSEKFVFRKGEAFISQPDFNGDKTKLNLIKKKYLDLYYEKINSWIVKQGFSSNTFARSSDFNWNHYGDILVVDSSDFYRVDKFYWTILLKNINSSKREYKSLVDENYVNPGIELILYDTENSKELEIAVENSFEYFIEKMEDYPRELFE